MFKMHNSFFFLFDFGFLIVILKNNNKNKSLIINLIEKKNSNKMGKVLTKTHICLLFNIFFIQF